MRLLTDPEKIVEHKMCFHTGRITVKSHYNNILIYAPSNPRDRVWEKLKTGNDIVIEVGCEYNEIRFDRILLCGVKVLRKTKKDVFECEITQYVELMDLDEFFV